MIIPAGVDSVELKQAIDPATGVLMIYSDGDPERNPQSYAQLVMRVPVMDIQELRARDANRQAAPAFPFAFALHRSGTRWVIMFNRKTDRRYYARFRFNPPVREI